MKFASKIVMAGASALAGISMMSAGSFALFTAHAQTKHQSFAAGVVDIGLKGQNFGTFSDRKAQLNYFNMVPGDYATGYAVARNTGSVNEIVNVVTTATGPIFYDDGLNNGWVQTQYGSTSSALEQQSPIQASAKDRVYTEWHPDLISATEAPNHQGWESYDYQATGDNAAYETDNHPAFYNLDYAIYSSSNAHAPTVSQTVGGRLLVSGDDILARHVIQPQQAVTLSYQNKGHHRAVHTQPWVAGILGRYDTAADKKGDQTLWKSGTHSAGTDISGNAALNGIVLAPGQYLVVEYSGQLPLKAHNDYQDAWGTVNVAFDAAQYENNHANVQQPQLGAVPSSKQPSPSSPTGKYSISGYVVSLFGTFQLGIPNARIWLERDGSFSKTPYYTNANGFFDIPNVSPGSYEVVLGNPQNILEQIAVRVVNSDVSHIQLHSRVNANNFIKGVAQLYPVPDFKKQLKFFKELQTDFNDKTLSGVDTIFSGTNVLLPGGEHANIEGVAYVPGYRSGNGLRSAEKVVESAYTSAVGPLQYANARELFLPMKETDEKAFIASAMKADGVLYASPSYYGGPGVNVVMQPTARYRSFINQIISIYDNIS
ncbi:TasA family protein [Alicyclobacillus sp. SP_1]|uniref:TasA family protein n=1 Tax=Alicyclobacillus sp. SP_1 TaxID=2942475 RepID=UPI0021588FBF|nr:TasA family protein [Alicyclobacillus sp. SP_1]